MAAKASLIAEIPTLFRAEGEDFQADILPVVEALDEGVAAGFVKLLEKNECVLVKKRLTAMKASAPQPAPSPPPRVTLLEVVRSPFKADWRINSPGVSTHARSCNGMQIVVWDLQEEYSSVRSYVEEALGSETIAPDPRYTGHYEQVLENEHQINEKFGRCVGEVVAEVLTAALGERITFYVCPRSENVEDGLPDFAMKKTGGVMVVTGEGKTPAVMRCMSDIDTSVGVIRSCAEQACDYIRTRRHRYGFLTYLRGTFFIERRADNIFAFTSALRCHYTKPSVAEMLTYITLKSLEEGLWADGGQPVPGAIPAAMLEQEPTKAPVGACSTHQQQRRSPRLAAAAGQQGQQQRHALHADGALQVSNTILGTGQTGTVRLASLNGMPCAVKMADTCKQLELVGILQNEVAAYERLSKLQGITIPVLHGCGYWRSGLVFFLATAYIEGLHPDPSMRAALLVAEEALQHIHTLGLVHGDVRADNILLQQTSGGTYRAWFLDFGHSHPPASQEECLEELADLRALFRASGASVDSDVSGACLMQD